MRDEDIGEVVLLLQLVEEVEHLRLHRHVEGGHGLVADDEPRVDGQGAGDGDALPLSARELVRVTVEMALVQAHPFQNLDGVLPPLLVVGVDAVELHRLHQRVADSKPLVER